MRPPNSGQVFRAMAVKLLRSWAEDQRTDPALSSRGLVYSQVHVILEVTLKEHAEPHDAHVRCMLLLSVVSRALQALPTLQMHFICGEHQCSRDRRHK